MAFTRARFADCCQADTYQLDGPGLPCSSPAADWRDQTVLQFRIMRKRALRQALERLGSVLRLDNPGAGTMGTHAVKPDSGCVTPNYSARVSIHSLNHSSALIPAECLTWA